jgi:hypothetical protein
VVREDFRHKEHREDHQGRSRRRACRFRHRVVLGEGGMRIVIGGENGEVSGKERGGHGVRG